MLLLIITSHSAANSMLLSFSHRWFDCLSTNMTCLSLCSCLSVCLSSGCKGRKRRAGRQRPGRTSWIPRSARTPRNDGLFPQCISPQQSTVKLNVEQDMFNTIMCWVCVDVCVLSCLSNWFILFAVFPGRVREWWKRRKRCEYTLLDHIDSIHRVDHIGYIHRVDHIDYIHREDHIDYIQRTI